MSLSAQSSWKLVGATVTGTAHLSISKEGQDCACFYSIRDRDGVEVLLVAVADGASFARHGERGAHQAVVQFIEAANATLQQRPAAAIGTAECSEWLRGARQDILDLAARDDLPPRDYSCTFAAAVVTPSAMLAMQLGDCIIALRAEGDDEWQLAFWPQKGDHPNETWFLPDDGAERKWVARAIPRRIAGIALSTDGLEDICLNKAAKTAFSPFFEAHMGVILRAWEEDTEELYFALMRYLDSAEVNERTSDDKTIVFGVRHPSA